MTASLPKESHPEPQSDQVFKKTTPSASDIEALKKSDTSTLSDKIDTTDYSKAVVRKPWGYEYLIYQNDSVAIWVLYLKEGHQTSMHCHPRKKTSISVMSGKAKCHTLDGAVEREIGEAMIAGKGVFHRTQAISKGGAFVMEIETPVNKTDLVRFKDDYGRESMGYESFEHLSFNLQNYNYISLIDSDVYYNAKKRFENCSIEFNKLSNNLDLQTKIKTDDWDLIHVLRGQILNDKGQLLFDVGDSFGHGDICNTPNLTIASEVEITTFKKIDTMVRLSEFVITHLKNNDVKNFFFVSETINAHLIDAIGRDTDVRSLPFQTELAATAASEAFSKSTNKPSVVVVSSGTSAINALSGVANAWVDSTPMVVISAQSRPSDFGPMGNSAIRQLANKETDIVSMARSITKHATTITKAEDIKKEINKALHIATHGRHGPVWIDIPIDILGANIDENELTDFDPSTWSDLALNTDLKTQLAQTLKLLQTSERPVLLAGFGIKAAGAQDEFIKLVKTLGIPVLTSRRGIDLISDDHPLYYGRPGTYGQRSANFIIQNADLLIAIGARLSIPLTGRNFKSFARGAKKVIVDIDPIELQKPTLKADVNITADAKEFILQFQKALSGVSLNDQNNWLAQCQTWQQKFPVSLESKNFFKDQQNHDGINSYFFIETLSEALEPQDTIVADGGNSLDYLMQTFHIKKGQTILSSPGLEHQGFALPGAIGASLNYQGHNIVCLCEKKGFQPHIHELQTIIANKLPIKIFIFNHKRGPSIQQVQASYFGDRYVGTYSDGVMGTHNLQRIGDAYGIPTLLIANDQDAAALIKKALAHKGPLLCEVRLPDNQEIIPRLTFTVKSDGKWISKPLEDMYPFLERDELKENMLIDMIDEN